MRGAARLYTAEHSSLCLHKSYSSGRGSDGGTQTTSLWERRFLPTRNSRLWDHGSRLAATPQASILQGSSDSTAKTRWSTPHEGGRDCQLVARASRRSCECSVSYPPSPNWVSLPFIGTVVTVSIFAYLCKTRGQKHNAQPGIEG